jgi:hypothetical protein
MTSLLGQTSARRILKDGETLFLDQNVILHQKSAGVVSGFGITDNLDGTIDVALGLVYLRSSNSDTDTIREYTILPTSSLALTDNSENYVYADYNGGVPAIKNTVTGSDVKDDENSKVEIYEIYREGTTLSITNHFQYVGNAVKRINRFLYSKFGHTRTSGLLLGETGTRNITVTSGKIWVKLNESSISSIDTSGSDTFDRYYYNGSAWVKQSAQTQWDNTQWNDITSGLSTMTANWYSYQEFFMLADGELLCVYGNKQSVNQNDIADEPVASSLPAKIENNQHSTYIGRAVFQKSAGTVSQFTNPFDTVTTFSQTNDHSTLSNLSNDDHTQYPLLAGRTGDILLIDNIGEFTSNGGVNIDHHLKLASTKTIIFPNEDLNDKIILKNTTHTIGIDTGNQNMRFNIPTGESFQFKINDVQTMALSLTKMDYDNGNFAFNQTGSLAPTVFSFADVFVAKFEKPDVNSCLLSSYKNNFRINSVDNIQLEIGGTDYGKIDASGFYTDNISQLTSDTGVTIEGVLFKNMADVKFESDVIYTNVIDEYSAGVGIQFQNKIKVDQIIEKTTDNGISIEQILLKDNIIQSSLFTASKFLGTDASKNIVSITDLSGSFNGTSNQITVTGSDPLTFSTPQNIHTSASVEFSSVSCDTISESSTDAGCTIEGVLLKDNTTISLDTNVIKTNTISEYTADNGVIIDQAKVKDGYFYPDNGTPYIRGNAGVLTLANSTDSIQISDAIYSQSIYDQTITADRNVQISSAYVLGYQSSTRKSKINIKDLENSNLLYKLKPVQFNYRKAKNSNEFHPRKEYGLIAEDCEKIYKNVCFYNIKKDHIHSCKDPKKCNCPSHKELAGINYDKFIPILIKCVQDQRKQIKTLQRRIGDLESI